MEIEQVKQLYKKRLYEPEFLNGVEEFTDTQKEEFYERFIKQTYYERLIKQTSAIYKVFGEDKVDIHFNTRENQHKIIVKYDKIEVTNRYEESTIIYDVYLLFSVSPGGIFSDNFELYTLTKTKAQHISGYKHSHTHKESGIKRIFCLGNSAIFYNTFEKFEDEPTEDNAYLLKLQLKEVLMYENLDDPYMRIGNIKEDIGVPSRVNLADAKNNPTYIESFYNDIITKDNVKSLFKAVEEDIIKINVIDNKVYTEYSVAELSKFLIEEGIETFHEEFFHYSDVPDEIYRIISSGGDMSRITELEDPYCFVFKGELKKEFKIIGEDEGESINNRSKVFIVNPMNLIHIEKGFAHYLKYKLYEKHDKITSSSIA